MIGCNSVDVGNAYLRGAGLTIAGLTSVVMQTKEFAESREQAGIPDAVLNHQVLDNCHAAHHISLALAIREHVSAAERMPMYRDLRTRLRNGQ